LVRGEFDIVFPDPPPMVNVNQGLTVNAGGVQQDIALKFIGPVTAADQSNLNWFETYQINLLKGPREFDFSTPVTIAGTSNPVFTKPFDYTGTKGFPDYEAYANQYIYNITLPIAGCNTTGKVFVGQRRDPFAINLGGVFDLINFIPVPGFPGAITESHFNNDINGHNIDTFSLELPISCILPNNAQGVVGGWVAVRELIHGPTGLAHIATNQTNRMGNPLVNELMIGLNDKNPWNLVKPIDDIPAGFATYVLYPSFAEILNLLFLNAVNTVLNISLATIAPTNFPRLDLFAVYMEGLPGINQPILGNTHGDVLRLNVTIPAPPARFQNRLGVIGGDNAGWPNGRRFGDDIIDATLQTVMGAYCLFNFGYCTPIQAPIGGVPLTDGAPVTALKFDSVFPYLKTPLAGSGGAAPRQRARLG